MERYVRSFGCRTLCVSQILFSVLLNTVHGAGMRHAVELLLQANADMLPEQA